ncbi:MAG: hypothetical protein LBE37_07095 [Sphingobacterium sp.]|jgi:DNA mismatch repair ATPase MutS|nr:hypothetical protein [Sphingobacterium sp.]
MRFYADKQTLNDLGFSSVGGKASVRQLFNKSKTRGGAEFLNDIMASPMADTNAIRKRIDILQYFISKDITFPFDGTMLDAASTYLENGDERSRLSVQKENYDSKLNKVLGVDSQTKLLIEGARAMLDVFATLRTFLAGFDQDDVYFKEVLSDMDVLFAEVPGMSRSLSPQKVSFDELALCDTLYRFKKRTEVFRVFYHIYQLDAWISVAMVAKEQGFAMPQVLESKDGAVDLKVDGLYHPLVPNAKANAVSLDSQHNVVFLTGANMAGKSTFMKSIGITVYLAHIGFPVPAQKMVFSAFDGLISSINLSDNIDMGYSHFLAEVKRIRMVAQMLSNGQRLFVLFDELFRGTNVKDAYEGTVELTKAFAGKRNSAFVISTHIIEAATDLKKDTQGIQYLFLPTIMEGTKPRYTYTLQPGVTADRHGMLIINNEGILERLSKADRNIKVVDTKVFLTDAQTQKDLNLVGRFDPNSIFSLFNRTRTKGGELLLEKWFQEPMVDADAINNRSAKFRYFTEYGVLLELNREEFSLFERYVAGRRPTSKMATVIRVFCQKVAEQVVKDEQIAELTVGIATTMKVLHELKAYMGYQLSKAGGGEFSEQLQWAHTLLDSLAQKGVLQPRGQKEFEWLQLADLDYQLSAHADQLIELIDLIYQIDVFNAVGTLAKERNFTYAKALDRSADVLDIQGGRHPRLVRGVGNDIIMQGAKNLLFLTGANMAGKSTFMKTASINLYLAHMGFPVAATAMTFSVREGIFTSINVDDSLQQGFSHYYAEVMRVKTIAQQVEQGKYLFVLFDELFKGTNVKDAFDATLAVTKSFVTFKRTFFIISTHIVEVGEVIAEEDSSVTFRYMPTMMVDAVPTYPYVAQNGISADKHGMIIIRNEGILELLDN